MRMRCLLFCLLFMGIIPFLKAQDLLQDSIVTKSRKFEIPKQRFGLTLSSYLHIYPTFQLSYDRRLSENVEWSIEGGYSTNILRKASGFRIRPSIERYVLRDKYIGFFVGAAVNSMNIWEVYDYTILYEDTYFRQFRKIRGRHQIGAFLTGGLKINIAGAAFLELSSGVGPTFLYNTNIEQPEENLNFNVWSERNGWTNRLRLYSNINISFPFGH